MPSPPPGSAVPAAAPGPAVPGAAREDRRRRPLPAALRVLAALAVAAVLAVVLTRYWPAFLAALRALRAPAPGWLAAAVAGEAASMGAYGRMQRRLLRGAGTAVPLLRAVALAYAAHSMSITLPGGPLVSTVYNYRRMRAFGADSTVAAWCTAASGVLSSLGLVTLAAATGLAAAADDADDVLTLAAVAAVLAGLAGTSAVLRRCPGARAALAGAGRRALGRLPAGWRARADAGAAWLARLLRVRIPSRDLAVAGVLSVANWAADGLCLAACCLALGVHPPAVALAATYVAAMTVSSVPLVPGGLGTVDGALALGLVGAGVATSPALAVVVLYRLISFALIGAVGWALWLVGRAHRAGVPPAPPG